MVKFFLYLLSLVYGLVVFIRNKAYDIGLFKSKEFDISVISIGNITVGGTGKTPHVEYLTRLLKKQYETATLSRGYKRKTKGFRIVETTSTSTEVGDEPLQIKNKFPDITVAVCENRVTGVEKLQQSTKAPDVVLLDDAFQHRRITPGINILLIDYNRQLKNDYLLPLGRLRERAYQTHRANIIIFTKCPKEVSPIMQRILQNDVNLLPYQKLFFTRLDYGKLQPVFDAPELNSSFYEDKKYDILAVSGIASPVPMQKHIKQLSRNIKTISYPDHYSFSVEDISAIEEKFNELNNDKKIIVTTEKDAMRLKDTEGINDEIKKVLYFLPIKIEFLEGEKESFNKTILNYVGENKSNRELYNKKNQRKS